MGTGRWPFLRALLLSVCALTIGFVFAKPAQADPHGVFFTVVGQQQLFFNILAALNQADYVEPLNLRTQLRQRRDESTYVSSQHSALRSTQTELADALTRQISLEGEDVRTQERADEYAREVVRQRQAAELIGQLCREAFGSEHCVLQQGPAEKNGDQRFEERSRAFVQDPVQYNTIPLIHGAGAALSSGTTEHTEAAQNILSAAQRGDQVLPLAYSPFIANLRLATGAYPEANPGTVGHLVGDIIETVRDELFGVPPTREQLQVMANSIRIDADGNISFQPSPGLSPEEQVAEQILHKNLWLDLQATVRREAEAAQQRVALQLQTADGAVADRVHKVRAGVAGDEYGELSVINTAPANVKEGLQENLLATLLALEGNPSFADPTQVDTPGGESAVDREGKAALKVGTPLEPLSKADVIEKGLLEQSGVTQRPGLESIYNDLQKWIAEIVRKL